MSSTEISRAAKRGGFKRGGFPIWTCPSFFVLFWDFPDFSGIFLICSGMVRGFSRIVLFLFLGLLRAPTRNSPERVRDTIWTFPEKSGKHPGLEPPRFSSGTKKKPKPKFLSPDIFWGVGGLPREGVGAKKFGISLETQGIKLFWRDIPGFGRDIPEAPEKFEKKMFGFNFFRRPHSSYQRVVQGKCPLNFLNLNGVICSNTLFSNTSALTSSLLFWGNSTCEILEHLVFSNTSGFQFWGPLARTNFLSAPCGLPILGPY